MLLKNTDSEDVKQQDGCHIRIHIRTKLKFKYLESEIFHTLPKINKNYFIYPTGSMNFFTFSLRLNLDTFTDTCLVIQRIY